MIFDTSGLPADITDMVGMFSRAPIVAPVDEITAGRGALMAIVPKRRPPSPE